MSASGTRSCGRERILTKPATSRLRLVLSQLIDQLRMPPAPGTTIPYPKLRNFVLDVLAEGRRKQIAHVLFEADVGGIKEQLAELRLRGGTLTEIAHASGFTDSSHLCRSWQASYGLSPSYARDANRVRIVA